MKFNVGVEALARSIKLAERDMNIEGLANHVSFIFDGSIIAESPSVTHAPELHFPEDDFVDDGVLVVVSSRGIFEEVAFDVVVILALVIWMIGPSSCTCPVVVVA